MLDLTASQQVNITPLSIDDVKGMDWQSVVGHPDTATVLSDVLGKAVAFNRTSVKLGKDDVLIVAQLTGGRLPQGATTLPDGFTFTFVKVTLD